MENLIDLALRHSEKLGAKYAEARLEEYDGTVYVFKKGNLETIDLLKSKGIGIRVLVNGIPGFASTNKLSKTHIKETIREAIKTARISSRLSTPIEFSEERSYKASWEVKPKIPFENISIQERINLFKDIDKQALSCAKKAGIKLPERLLELSEGKTKKHFKNSEGTEIECEIPRIHFEWRLTAHKGADTEQDTIEKGGSGGWEITKQWSLISEAKERVETLGKILKTAKKPPKGKLDLVLGKKVVGLAVHESCGHPYEADRILGREGVQAGESFVTPKMIGERIGSELVTIVDDPTLKGSYGYYEYDDEGVKARRRVLMKRGVINELLHNRETAKKFNVTSNAAARASAYNREPIVRMANTYMLPGDYSFEELLEGVKFGIFIRKFEEWNIDDRRFNMRFRGKDAWLIENGQLTKMVRRPVLDITTPVFYSSIDGVDKDIDYQAATCGKGDPMQGAPVWFGGPNIRLRDIKVR